MQVVCSDTYLPRYEGREKPGKGLWGTWEAAGFTAPTGFDTGSGPAFATFVASPVPFGVLSCRFFVTSTASATHSRDYEGRKSAPEWRINVSTKNILHLDEFAFERQMETFTEAIG